MKKRVKLKGRIKTYIQFGIYLGILLCVVDAAIFLVDVRAGVLLLGFTIFYLAVTLSLYFYNKPIIMNTTTFTNMLVLLSICIDRSGNK